MHFSFEARLRPAAFAALLALAAGAAHAQSSVSIYGLVDMSAGQFQNAGEAKLKRVQSGNLSTSYLGFSGTEDLGGGLKATFALESFFLADTGGAGRFGPDVFWARASNVGIAGSFGSLRAGRASPPLFVSTLLFNPFGDSFGFSPSIRQWYNNAKGAGNAVFQTPLIGDSGWSNGVFYGTPKFGGLSANVAVTAGEGGVNKGPNYGANVLYFGGPFSATLAWQHVEANGPGGNNLTNFAGFDHQEAWQLGASYDFGMVKLFGQYGQITTDATLEVKTKNAQVGASVPVGAAGAVLASYGESKREGGVGRLNKTLTLGYDHNLSKRTDLYAIYMSDKLTGFDTGNTYAIGLRHKF
ncbi:porin [uncultured Aquincola sp.]|uniref:porin n=1 Tax=uncultured Aquincola sp. TaxID=886556 RepID=UPI0032B12D2A